MVTHIPSASSSQTSLPLSSPTTSRYRPAYASSQAGSISASRHYSGSQSSGRNPPSLSYFPDDRHHRRTASTASTSSQTTLVPIIPPAPQSVAGYPTSPPSAYGYAIGGTSRRAPSVASTSAARHTSGHRHRASSRSRSRREVERESEAAPFNSFPWFGQTGDVEVTISDYARKHSKTYLLHRLILAQNAAWFEEDKASLKVNSSSGALNSVPAGPTNAGVEKNTWRYELDWSCVREDANAVPLLVRSDSPRSQASHANISGPPTASIHNKPQLPPNTYSRSLGTNASNGRHVQPSEDQELLTAYDNLFLIFYNHSPSLSTTNIATAYVESKLLLSLASSYSALGVVGPRIDHHLLQFGSRLWRQIAKYPPSYLKLGHLAKSKAIFSEALIHVVGQWPVGQPQLRRGTVDDAIVDLIEDKVDELEDTKLRIEAKLFRISLTTGRGERVSPSNAYVEWLAISLFRQWVAEHTAQAPAGILKDSPASNTGRTTGRSSSSAVSTSRAAPVTPQTSSKLVRTYRLLGQGGQSYLTHDELKRFLKLHPELYTREALRKFERRMEELKHLAKDAVRPLTRNWLQLEQGDIERRGSAGGYTAGASSSSSSLPSYLTCARCEERDFAYVWSI